MPFRCLLVSSSLRFVSRQNVSYLKRILACLFDPDLLDPGCAKLLQTFVDLDAEVFSGRHGSCKFGKAIEIRVIVALDYLARHKGIELRQITDHALGVDLPA